MKHTETVFEKTKPVDFQKLELKIKKSNNFGLLEKP